MKDMATNMKKIDQIMTQEVKPLLSRTLSTTQNTSTKRTSINKEKELINKFSFDEEFLNSKSSNFPKWVPENMKYEILFEFDFEARNRNLINNRHCKEIQEIKIIREEEDREVKRWLRKSERSKRSQNDEKTPRYPKEPRPEVNKTNNKNNLNDSKNFKDLLLNNSNLIFINNNNDFAAFALEEAQEIEQGDEEEKDGTVSVSSSNSSESGKEEQISLIVDHIIQEIGGGDLDFDLEDIVRELVGLEERDEDITLGFLEEVFGIFGGNGRADRRRVACFNVYARLVDLM